MCDVRSGCHVDVVFALGNACHGECPPVLVVLVILARMRHEKVGAMHCRHDDETVAPVVLKTNTYNWSSNIENTLSN